MTLAMSREQSPEWRDKETGRGTKWARVLQFVATRLVAGLLRTKR